MREEQANYQGKVSAGYAADRGAAMVSNQMGECAAARMTAKGVMRQRAQTLRREADRLEALCKALPEELPMAADEALWDLLSAAKR